jgi:hypothetical protein
MIEEVTNARYDFLATYSFKILSGMTSGISFSASGMSSFKILAGMPAPYLASGMSSLSS